MSQASESPESEKNAQKNTSLPKRRGRKRKSEVALQKQIEDIIETAESQPREETISRRGRPRKKVNYYELANPENLEMQIKYTLEEDEASYKKKKVEKREPSFEKSEDVSEENNEISNGVHQETLATANEPSITLDEETEKCVSEDPLNSSVDLIEATTSTPNNNKDKKYNYTGETVKMMNTLFNLFSNNSEENTTQNTVNKSNSNNSIKLESSKRSTKKVKKIEIKEEEEVDDNVLNITCAICNVTMDKNLWSHHKQRYHNNLAWRVGDTPLDLNDQSLVMHTLNNLYKKKKPLYCDKCGEFKKSVVGFLSHRSQCLKSGEQLESVKVACPICGRKMLPVSMTTHMKTIHQSPEKTKHHNNSSKSVNDLSKAPIGKRSAAKRAMRIIENVTKTDKDKYFTTNLDFESQDFAKALMLKELNETQFIECKFRCNCITTNMEDAFRHYEECTEKPKQGFVCKQCLYVATRLEDILQHVELNHEINVTSVEDNDDSTFVEEDCGGGVSSGNSSKLPTFLRCDVKRTEKVLFPFAFEWTYKFCEENYSPHLFETLTTSNWSHLSPDETVKYLPTLDESCGVARLHVTSFIDPLTQDYTFKKFKLFESEIQDGNKVTIFCGGPISSMAWLPTPHKEENVHQILAVSVLSTPDAKYQTYEHYSENSCIQFWDFGVVHNKQFVNTEPKLRFVLTHTHGPVWHMEWCPSGCYEKDSRMGVLGVTGSDSVVYIYSVPFFTEEKMGLYYKSKPVIKLLLQHPETPLLGKIKYYASKISWSKFSGHNYVAVGYTNGFVALFNLKSNSVMLNYTDSDGVPCILPSKCFQAHSHAITALSLYHLNNGCRWLLTGSVDRGVSLWDLNNSSYPISHIKKNTITDGFWLTNWLCYVTTFDEASTTLHVTTMLKQARDYLYEPSVTLTCSASTISTVTGSDWLNGILHANSVGEIVGSFPHQVFSLTDHQKMLRAKRMLFGFTYLIEKNKTPEERINNDRLRKKTLQNLATKKMSQGVKLSKIKSDFNCDTLFVNEPVLYEEAEEKYALLFCDNKMENYGDFPKNTIKQLTALSKLYQNMLPNQYPLTAINKIMFNPNRQASLYYATGYQAGFVRISWLQFLKNDKQIK